MVRLAIPSSRPMPSLTARVLLLFRAKTGAQVRERSSLRRSKNNMTGKGGGVRVGSERLMVNRAPHSLTKMTHSFKLSI